eukprot:2475276-Ditylum_brightwellii.AAC.1
MYGGLFEEEVGNSKELWYGQLKRSSICYELDPNYLHKSYGWTMNFIEKCKTMEGKWVHVEAGATYSDCMRANHPNAALPEQKEYELLGKQWTPSLKRGNPPVLFQQVLEVICLFDATTSVLAYYGDHTAAKYINSKRHIYNPFNCMKVTMDGDKFVFSLPPYRGKPNKQLSWTLNYAQQCMHLLSKVGVIESSDG